MREKWWYVVAVGVGVLLASMLFVGALYQSSAPYYLRCYSGDILMYDGRATFVRQSWDDMGFIDYRGVERYLTNVSCDSYPIPREK